MSAKFGDPDWFSAGNLAARASAAGRRALHPLIGDVDEPVGLLDDDPARPPGVRDGKEPVAVAEVGGRLNRHGLPVDRKRRTALRHGICPRFPAFRAGSLRCILGKATAPAIPGVAGRHVRLSDDRQMGHGGDVHAPAFLCRSRRLRTLAEHRSEHDSASARPPSPR